jgi:hypothetical protein
MAFRDWLIKDVSTVPPVVPFAINSPFLPVTS